MSPLLNSIYMNSLSPLGQQVIDALYTEYQAMYDSQCASGTPNDVYSNFEDIFEPKQNFQSFRASIQHNQPRNSSWTSHNGDRPKINHNNSSNFRTENFCKQNESNKITVSPFCNENQKTKLLQIKDSLLVTKNSKPAKIISQPRAILSSIDQNKFHLTKASSLPPNEKFQNVQENIITEQFVPSIKPKEIYESFDSENNYQSKVYNKYSTNYFYDLEELHCKSRNKLNTSGQSVYSKSNRLFQNVRLSEDEHIDLLTYCSPEQSHRTESFQDRQTSGTDRLMESQPLFNQLKGATTKQESHDSNLSDLIDFQFQSPSGKYKTEMISHRNTALQIPVLSTSKNKYKMALQPQIDSKDGKTNSQHNYKQKTVRSSDHAKCLSVYNNTDLCNDVWPIENMPQSIKNNLTLLDIDPVNKIQPSIVKNIQTNMSNVCYNESLKQLKPGFSNNYESINEQSDEESNKIWDDIAWFDVLSTKLKNCQKQNSIPDSLNSSDASFITNQVNNESFVINKHDSCDEHIIDYNNDLSNDSISFSDICDQHSFFDGGKVNASCDEQKFNSQRSMVQKCPESSNDVQMLNSQTSQSMNTAKISNSNSQFDKVSEDDFSWLDEILFTGTPDKHIYTDSHTHKNEKSSPESKKLRNNILVTKTSPSIEESSDIFISQETKQIVCGKSKQEIKNNPKIKQKFFQTKTAIDNTHITVSFMNPFLPKWSRKRSNKKMNTINKPCDALRKEHFVYDDNEDNKREVTIGSANITSNAEKITKLDMSKPRMSLTCRKTRKLLKKASTFKSPLIQTTLHFNKKHSENMLGKGNEDAICFNFLTEEMFADIENKMVEHKIQEVALTIIYKEGFCQLNKPEKSSKSARCTQSGIMFAISSINSNTKYYFLRINPGDSTNTGATRNFLQYLLSSPFRKICYEAQEMYSYLIDMFHFPARQVCLTWLLLDPLVGCWLLDPDQPVHTFSEAIDRFGVKPAVIKKKDNFSQSCQLLGVLSLVVEKLYHNLSSQKLWKLFVDMEMRLVPLLAVMELRGISVDIAKLEKMNVLLKDQIDLLEASAHKAAGKLFHLNSTVQLRSILYEEMKLDQKHSIHIKETISLKAKSTSEPVLRQLEAVHPLPGIILKYRHLHKLRSTYVEGMIQHIQRNYIFTTWDQTATATGRLTSSNPNLQAVPKHEVSLKSHVTAGPTTLHPDLLLRSPYVPRPGYTFLAADFQHIEFRLFAHLAQDPTLLQVFQQPEDIFLTLAQLWLGKVVGPEDREKTKRIVYSVMYGAGAGKLAEFLQLDNAAASRIINSFMAKFPSIRSFFNLVVAKCRRDGKLHTIGGRQRLFPNIRSSNGGLRAQAERQAINFVIQGSAADLCKSAMLRVEQRLGSYPDLEAHLLLQIHDELVYEVRDSQLQQIKVLVKEVMEDNTALLGESQELSIPLPVIITTGKNWADVS